MTSLSLYQQFAEKWSTGCGSGLCDAANRICLARGTVPCDVLFLGEAPGESENVLGRPFVGPAGHLLDSIIKQSLPSEVSYALTNLVCCIPREEDGLKKAAEPLPDEIRACAPRLQEFVQLCEPKLIVAVGALATTWLDTKFRHSIRFHREIPNVSIRHPAALLRINIAMRSLEIRRCVVALQNAVGEYVQ